MVALALYIHWPFCASKCPYCDFNSHVREGVDQAAWREALLAEIDHAAARVPERKVTSVFFGGGTPSLMPPTTVEALLARIALRWPVAEGLEVTLEANPTSVEAAKLRDFRAAGVNRLSMGIQSLRDEALKFLGRRHSAAEALRALETAAALFDRTSFDLIYALPGQTADGWEAELRAALPLARGHLSLYQLTIEENTAFHHAYHTDRAFVLPDDDTAAELYRRTQQVMDAAGLPAYEISNHAAPGQECRHNLSYWKSEDYAGIGPGAHGRLTVDGARLATVAIKSPELWLSQVRREGHGWEPDTPLTPRERLEERVMMGLRLTEGCDFSEARDWLNSPVVTAMQSAGMVWRTGDRLGATPSGRLLLTSLTGRLLGSDHSFS